MTVTDPFVSGKNPYDLASDCPTQLLLIDSPNEWQKLIKHLKTMFCAFFVMLLINKNLLKT